MLTWLSGFLLNPALAAGALGVASPILIHFLSRRRFRRIRWAAMDFLLDAQRKNRRRVQIEQLILLALRCLAVLLIAMMIARPFLSRGTFTSIIGAGPRSERIILLDDSLSMAARSGGGQTSFGRATQTAQRLTQLFSGETPVDAVSVWLTSNPAQPLIAVPRIDGPSARRIADAIEGAAPSHRTAQLDTAITALASASAAAPTQANATLYVVSDFQKTDWAPSDSIEGPSLIVSPMERLKQRAGNLSIVFIDVSSPQSANLALVGLRASQPQVVAGVPARFEAQIANFSASEATDLDLSLSLADQVIPPVHIGRLAAGETRREPLEVIFPGEGSAILSARIVGSATTRDALTLDDQRAVAVEVLPSVHVLLVDGEPSGDPFRDEVYLLKTALRPAGRAASGNDVTVISEADLDGFDLTSVHVVVLANVARLNPAGLRSLETFARGGGGVIIMAGRQLDIPWYNESLHREGKGLLPVPIGEFVETAAGGESPYIAEWDVTHPVMRAFVEPLAAALRQVHIDAFVALRDPDAPPTNIADSSAASQPASAPAPQRVLARISNADRSPLMVEGQFGRGLCIVISTTADQDWNNWASSFSYVPIMLELVQYAAKPGHASMQATVGQPLICPVDPRRFADIAVVRGPEYPVAAEATLRARSSDEGAAFVHDQTDKIGAYEFSLRTTGGQAIVRRACVNPDPRESDLAAMTKLQLEAALPGISFTYARDVETLADDSKNLRTEMWWPLLIIAVMLLMAEQTLAWWFGTRG